MPVDRSSTLILLAVIANLAVMAPSSSRRCSAGAARSATARRPSIPSGAPPRPSSSAGCRRSVTDDGVPPGAYDRVVRIVAWVFILATSTIVAVTGLWPETQAAIFVLLALAGLFVLVVHDLLPPGRSGPRSSSSRAASRSRSRRSSSS